LVPFPHPKDSVWIYCQTLRISDPIRIDFRFIASFTNEWISGAGLPSFVIFKIFLNNYLFFEHKPSFVYLTALLYLQTDFHLYQNQSASIMFIAIVRRFCTENHLTPGNSFEILRQITFRKKLNFLFQKPKN
jgi:hypothetical protein